MHKQGASGEGGSEDGGKRNEPGADAGRYLVGPGTHRTLAMAAGVSARREGVSAAEEAADACVAGMAQHGEAVVDLALVFISPHHGQVVQAISDAIHRRLGPRCLLGTTAETVIGGRHELEGAPGISILAGSLPGVTLSPFSSNDLPVGLSAPAMEQVDGEEDLAQLAGAVGMCQGHRCTLLLADPFSTPMDRVLPALVRARSMCSPGGAGPGDLEGAGRRGPIIGGLASASQKAGGNALLLNGRCNESGLVGVSLSGGVRVDSVVSQGCRPLGGNMVVTAAKGHAVGSLGGKPALEVLQELVESLDESQRQMLSQGLMLGRVVNEYKERFGSGDYLLREVRGVNQESGAIVVEDTVRVGQTVRFHVRDAAAADRDLAMLMDAQSLHDRPLGALLVTCRGRGSGLFKALHHDASAVQRAFAEPAAGEQRARGGVAAGPQPSLPLAGFFAAGEIGPVGDDVFVHGQTACVALFRKPNGMP